MSAKNGSRGLSPVCPGLTEVDLWWARVPQGPDLVEESSYFLTQQELERAGRIRDLPSRHRYLAGRVALRRLLGTYLGRDPRRISIKLSPEGKPNLGDGEPHEVTFNLSHSGEWVLLAFSTRASVGVDVESVAGFHDLEGVAARVLTRGELAELRALSSGLRIDAFFRAWTRKEALLKALGTGLGGGATQLPTGMGTPGPTGGTEVIVRPPGRSDDWSVVGVKAPVGYCAAVAKEGVPLRIRSTRTQKVGAS